MKHFSTLLLTLITSSALLDHT